MVEDASVRAPSFLRPTATMADVVPKAAASEGEAFPEKEDGTAGPAVSLNDFDNVSFVAKFSAQFKALMKKNLILQRRNMGATIAQLFVGPLFIIIITLIATAIKANQSSLQEVQDTIHPEPIVPPAVPKCFEYEGKRCWDFGYAPKNVHTDAIVSKMMEIGNIPSEKVKSFAAVADVNDWLLANENTTQLVVLFSKADKLNTTQTIQYTIQMNTTVGGGLFGNRELKEIRYRQPFQQLIYSGFLRWQGKASGRTKGQFKNFPHPSISIGYDVIKQEGASMMFIAAAFNFVVQMYMIADEKERKLRSAMEKMGMLDSVYWITWYFFDICVNMLVVLNLFLFGAMFNFEVFLENSFGLTFLLLWLCANCFTALGFFLCTFASKAESALSLGLLFFVVFFLFGGPILQSGWSGGDTDPYKFIRDISLTVPTLGPAALFYSGLGYLIDQSAGQTATGMKWEDRFENILPASKDDNVFTFNDFFGQLLFQIVYHLALAWYFDNVLPNSYGRKKSPLFFLFPSYWSGQATCGRVQPRSPFKHVPGEHEDEDVTKEANRIIQRTWETEADAPSIIIEGLYKTFVSGGCRRCKPCTQVKKFNAVDGISYGVEKGQAFVLLGHNGAGKTTTINMLVGNLDVSSGHASVDGLNVRTQMRSINHIMGVCPQHDILWGALTGQEHLELFCRLRGFPEALVQQEVDARLKDVLLDDPKTRMMPSKSYSGGMQRRLSIAISLIGNPKVVYLDEPTTGMDPVTRREVWDMIQRAKRDRVIILTTHSMEEADVLGDNIGVMSHGKIQAFGSATRLKKRFGAGYKMTLFVDDPKKEKEVVDFVTSWKNPDTEELIGCKVEQTISRGTAMGPVLFLSLAKNEDELALFPFFKELEEKKADLGVSDFSVGLSTLEEVFLELSKRDHFIPGKTEQKETLRVPLAGTEGLAAGAQIQANDRFGREHKVMVDDANIAAGYVDVEIMVPEETSEATAVEVDVEKVVEKAGDAKTVSVMAQSQALFFKTLQWQRRHKAQLFSNICFPVFIMILLLILDQLVFGLLREAALCGQGIKYSECKEKGINLTCAGKALARVSQFETPLPAPYVGEVQAWGQGGVGINPNCGQDANGKRACFNGLEKPQYHGIYSKSSASRTITVDPSLKDFYNKFRTKVASSNCQELFEQSLSCRPGRRGGDWYCTGRKDVRECQKECNKVAQAKDKFDAQDENEISTPSNPLASCIPDDGSRRRLAAKPTVRKLVALTAKEQEYYDIYLEKLETKTTCDKKFLLDLAKLLDNGGVDISSKISSAKTSLQASGVFSHLTTELPPYTYLPHSSEPMLDEGTSAVFSAITSHLTSDGNVKRGLLARRGPKAFCATVDLTTGKVGNTSIPNLKSNITSIFSKDPSAPTTTAFDNLCAMMKDMDIVRGLSIANKESTEKLDKDLYDDWNGNEIKFSEYEGLANEIGYRWHYYETPFVAFDFSKEDDTNAVYDYTIYHNTTATKRDDTKNWMSLTQMMNNAIMKKHTNKNAFMMTKQFPSKFVCKRDEWLDNKRQGKVDCPALLFGFLGLNIPDFFLGFMMPWFMILYGYSMVVLVTYEKEHKLRIIMQMQGLRSSVYFWVNYLYFLLQFMTLCFVLTLFGLWANLNLFKLHHYGVVLYFFFLWGNVMIAFFLTVSLFFNSTRLAQTMTFLLILIMVFTGSTIVSAIVQNPAATEDSWTFMMFIPPFVMMRFTQIITILAAVYEKVTFGNMYTIFDGSLGICINCLWGHWFFWMFLRWYLEQVLVVGHGTQRDPLFIFRKEFWREEVFGNAAKRKENSGLDKEFLAKLPAEEEENGLKLPRDVEAEHKRIVDSLSSDEQTDAIRIVSLRKTFPGSGKNDVKTAVRTVSFGVKKRECFGLLGHNGAGKTTTINMMTGLFPPTEGTGLIENYNIKDDLDKIYTQMGVCPQHNILWGELSAEQHQYFFGRLKGHKGKQLKREVNENLAAVNLEYARSRPSAGFSGGMQRRLSVANSIVGNPRVVYMDEPSTGLDPASRRQLWDVIVRAKKNKSVVLTTHSMEEADVLCDRVGIMSGGRLLCIGPAYDLKRRFGRGYTCVLSTTDKSLGNTTEVNEWITSIFPSASLLEDPISGTFKYEIDRREVVVSEAFSQIVSRKSEIGLADWGFTETTLEEVFLKLSHLHGNENPEENTD